MDYLTRSIESSIRHQLTRGKSVLLLGARQTGKTTLIKQLNPTLSLSFIYPQIRQRYEKSPDTLRHEILALPSQLGLPIVAIDEVQKIPQIMDVIQGIIDENLAQFILSGSSARKLRHGAKINLLPGRLVVMHLDPFSLDEMQQPYASIESLILDGSLPGVFLTPNTSDREIDLQSYVTTYLEEEIRAEAVVRQIGTFSRFLEWAASESGQIINLTKLSQQIGVSHSTISAYYQIVEDCLIAERVEAYTNSSTRHRLTKSPRYLFFDMGVRRVCAREGREMSEKQLGHLFEHFVGIELLRSLRSTSAKLHFWRDPSGPEIDWLIVADKKLTPIEVKWTDSPSDRDCRHLRLFLAEYPESEQGYIVCRTPRRMKLGNMITAIPWQEIHGVVGAGS